VKLWVVMPLYNDWESAAELLRELDNEAANLGHETHVLIVDDASPGGNAAELRAEELKNIGEVQVLPLRRNLGHQRAIAIGLTWLLAEKDGDAVVVMDSDGEDRPADIAALLKEFEKHGRTQAIFAARARRTESLVFKLGYAGYKALHYLLTGIRVRVGNFSIIPFAFLHTLAVSTELWNHYAASVYALNLPHVAIPIDRGTRYRGHSKMNLLSLMLHGMSAISVFAEKVSARVLAFSVGLGALIVACLLTICCIRIFTDLAIPGWASVTGGLLLVLLAQIVGNAGMFLLLLLHGRSRDGFLPIRDYLPFIRRD